MDEEKEIIYEGHHMKTGGDCWCEPTIIITSGGFKIITHEDTNV